MTSQLMVWSKKVRKNASISGRKRILSARRQHHAAPAPIGKPQLAQNSAHPPVAFLQTLVAEKNRTLAHRLVILSPKAFLRPPLARPLPIAHKVRSRPLLVNSVGCTPHKSEASLAHPPVAPNNHN